MSYALVTASGAASREPDTQDWDWADRGTPHVAFSRDEPLPFQEGDLLGHGVNGPVVKTVIKGVCVALKRIYCRQGIGRQHLQEIEIIRKLMHPHIIQLAGSYTRGPYLGLLIYPVARCDLATYLEDIDYLLKLDGKLIEQYSRTEHSERLDRFKAISRMDDKHPIEFSRLSCAARARLWECFGCITDAMLYLHESSIRHKDLKPLNILLSRDGLWLTDFGHSIDFSELSTSATTGGERGTLKYCAPEVAAYERSGRSADVFALGCIFFEMGAIGNWSLDEAKNFRPSLDRSYHNNLDNIFSALNHFGTTPLEHLTMSVAREMISKDPAQRPTLALVSTRLKQLQAFSTIEPLTFPKIQCRHHSRQLPFDAFTVRDDSREFNFGSSLKEIHVTIGNTCLSKPDKPIRGSDRMTDRYGVVIFVDCSSTEYIECVIFVQVGLNLFQYLGFPLALHDSITLISLVPGSS